MKRKSFPAFIALSAITAMSTQAATITITDYSLAPNGLNESTTFQATDAAAINGGSILPTANGTVVYVVSTFTFGASSDAHLQWQFGTSTTAKNRIGIEVQDAGLIQTIGTANGVLENVSPTTPKRTSVNLNTDLAGQTVILLAKLYYHSSLAEDLGARTAASPAGGASNGDDTVMNVWINPTTSDVEGNTSSAADMIGNGDLYAVWNSASFTGFFQTIQNQNTPGTSGTSTIGDTTILTGANATFANALALATIPEPSAALLGGLGALLLLRRRRA